MPDVRGCPGDGLLPDPAAGRSLLAADGPYRRHIGPRSRRRGTPVEAWPRRPRERRPTYAPVMARSLQTLRIDDRRVLASWAADCAEHVLAIFEEVVPGDARVRAAIEQTRAFAAGRLDVEDALRRRGGEAGAAAREAPTPAARAAAYAAEQAAAVAHMGAHALGAAGYAAKASTLAAGCDDATVTRSEAHRQVAAMTDAVARALRPLPAVGENRSGPLGPGRLSGGHVGEAIRAVQALLEDRSRSGRGPSG
jgi:hypothetical protein